MLPLGVIHPVFPSFVHPSARGFFPRLARSREINLTVPSGACPGLFMLGECTHSFLLGPVPLLLLLVSSAFQFTSGCGLLPCHIWLRPTTLTLCAPASVVWVHVVMSVYVERERAGWLSYKESSYITKP